MIFTLIDFLYSLSKPVVNRSTYDLDNICILSLLITGVRHLDSYK